MALFAALPVPLRRYVVAVAVAGPLLACILVAQRGVSASGADMPRAALLLALAIAAYRYPLCISHKYQYDLAAAAYLAMVLTLPTPWPGALAIVASIAGRTRWRWEPSAELFNLGQAGLHVSTAALAFAALRDVDRLGPQVGGLGSLGAIALTAATVLATNTGLVSGAIALQTGSRFLRVWRGMLSAEVLPHATVSAVGIVAALLARDYPLALPVLALPVVLVHRAMRQSVQLRADTREALVSLVDILEMRDPYTAGHSFRVAELAHAISLRLGLTAEEADAIELAGTVHDLGKVALDPAILLKYGKLDEREWTEVKKHPGLGAEVLRRFAVYGAVHDLVRSHHERWDGGGYPDGLAGEAIPLGARILAVADAYDAMTTMRSYRPAKSPEVALHILEEGAGSQWDAAVVREAVAYLRETEPITAPVLSPAAAAA